MVICSCKTNIDVAYVLKKNLRKLFSLLSLFFFFFVVLELELRAFTSSHSTQPYFCEGFFDIGSHKLFAWAGFEP
jgi:hypothetical protein